MIALLRPHRAAKVAASAPKRGNAATKAKAV